MDKRKALKIERLQSSYAVKFVPKLNPKTSYDSLEIGEAITKQIVVGFETALRNK